MLDVPNFHKLFRFYKLTRIYLPIMYSLNNPIASWTPSTPSLEVTFDSYLYKTVQGNDPVGDLKLGWKTLSSLYKYNNQTLGLALGSILENLTFDRTILTCLSWLYVMVGTKARLEKAGFLHRPLCAGLIFYQCTQHISPVSPTCSACGWVVQPSSNQVGQRSAQAFLHR